MSPDPIEHPATFEPGEPEPPYVDDSPPAEPDEVADPEPAFQPRNDVVDEGLDLEAEVQGGIEP